jgi:hypothetical protein
MKKYLIIFVLSVAVYLEGAVIKVTTTEDMVPGSLRAAITTANTNGEDNVIYLPMGTYILKGDPGEDNNATGDLDILTKHNLTIIGDETIILEDNLTESIVDGNDNDRIFHIFDGKVRLFNVTVRNGNSRISDIDSLDFGAGGGIHLETGALSLYNCVIKNNITGVHPTAHHRGSDGGAGGGIFNWFGTLTLKNCIIVGNRTSTGDSGMIWGGDGGDGGGICNRGTLFITNSTISNNTTGDGASNLTGGNGGNGSGIWNSGNMEISNCCISLNFCGCGAISQGGGTYGEGSGGNGGGIYNSAGTVNITNCTISGNSTGKGAETQTSQGRGGNGGGIWINKGNTTVKSCTITDNFTGTGKNAGADISSSGGGLFVQSSDNLDIGNTIIAFNQVASGGKGPDCYGTLTSLGYNLIEDTKDCTLTGDPTGNIFAANPLLGYLSKNGGWTQTHALLKGSPAIDAGKAFGCSFDQRGYARTHDVSGIINVYDGTDIGAYEFETTSTPYIAVVRTQFYFAAISSGVTSPPQTFLITKTGVGTLNWTVTTDQTWLNCNPVSGVNAGSVSVSVDSTGLGAGTYWGTISVTDPYASNSPQQIGVLLNVYPTNQSSIPWGTFETPIDGSTVSSSIPVTGWVLDDIGVESVKIYRGEVNNLVYIGDAVFVEGARPDVEQAFPGYPNNHKAGWGYMMLTNFLPNSGNGTFNFHAVATDMEGNEVILGSKLTHVDNASAIKPFGAIDTPTQGGTASGSDYLNWGWVLTPQPNNIPTDGSTIDVWVDGLKVGHPTYNLYRADIARLFPAYANSNGAVGYIYLDTTTRANGVHTIQWTATDSAGNTDGIGSRYFNITNLGSLDFSSQATPGRDFMELDTSQISVIPFDLSQPVAVSIGYNDFLVPKQILPDKDGITKIRARELDRMQIKLPGEVISIHGFQLVDNQLQPLPAGFTLDAKNSLIIWQMGVGFNGTYDFLFIITELNSQRTKKRITVQVNPKLNNPRFRK